MSDRTTNSTALKRSAFLGFAFLAVFAVLLLRILALQTFSFEKYQSKVINQVTTASPVAANRGKIYDRNGNVLATNRTVWRIYISPTDIRKATKKDGKDYADAVAKGLSEILSISYESVLGKAKNSAYLDQTIAKSADEETVKRVLVFAKPTPQGIPTHFMMVSLIRFPYSKYPSLSGSSRWMNASSIEYCSISGENLCSRFMILREISLYRV